MADSNQIVGASIQVDTGSANANVSELNKNLATTKQALKDTGAAATTTGKSVEGSAGSFGKLKEQMAGLPGPLSDSAEGVSKLDKVFKTLLANPIVLTITLIVGALGFLYKAFTNSFEGGEKMEQVFAGIKAAASVLLDSILDIGSAVIKLFSGDFKGALQDAKDAVDGVVHGVADAYGQVSKLTAQAQALHKEQLQNDLDQANRAKQLAILREQATDETIPVAKRKAALLELKALAEQNAKEDIDLATRTRDNMIAINSVGKDAALKNMDQISKAKIAAVQVETDNANELRRIGKQITAANAAELAERKANAQKAADEAKKNREQMEAYNSQLTKLRQQNALAGIVDQYTKEQQALENHIQDEANALKKLYDDKKLTRQQYENLSLEAAKSAQLQRDALTKKHQDDVQANEQKFQNQLIDIRNKIRLAGITDQAEKEKVELEIEHEKELAQAIVEYQGDAAKLFQVKQDLDKEYALKQAAIDAKNKAAADKKKLEDAKRHTTITLNDPKSTFKAMKDAVDAEQALTQQAFDNKAITEQEYNDKLKGYAEDRVAIKQKELAEMNQITDATAGLLDDISEAVGKTTATGKALAIAAATIKALAAEVTIIANMADVGPFGFALGLIAAAATAVTLFNTIKQIEAVQVPGQASGGSSVPSPPSMPSAPIAPTQQSTRLPTAQIDAMGSAVAQSNAAQPVRAFVIDADVKNNQDRDARLTRASRLGG